MLLVAGGLLALVGGGYGVARQSSLFAVTTVEVVGAPPPVAAQVRSALAPLRRRSLVAIGGGEIRRRVADLTTVVAVGFDRAFPHTLRVVVLAERPVAVLRRGRDSWLVSARGRVIRTLRPAAEGALPRIWVRRAARVEPGSVLDPADGGAAARILAPLARDGFPTGVRAATATGGELMLSLTDGVALRLGKANDLALKLAVARRIVPRLPAGTAYLDVSVPERPVAGQKAQLSAGGLGYAG
jgi:cell division protein FtsQ